jgi:hypothetical protein
MSSDPTKDLASAKTTSPETQSKTGNNGTNKVTPASGHKTPVSTNEVHLATQTEAENETPSVQILGTKPPGSSPGFAPEAVEAFRGATNGMVSHPSELVCQPLQQCLRDCLSQQPIPSIHDMFAAAERYEESLDHTVESAPVPAAAPAANDGHLLSLLVNKGAAGVVALLSKAMDRSCQVVANPLRLHPNITTTAKLTLVVILLLILMKSRNGVTPKGKNRNGAGAIAVRPGLRI